LKVEVLTTFIYQQGSMSNGVTKEYFPVFIPFVGSNNPLGIEGLGFVG
jgi:hypothetical protein